MEKERGPDSGNYPRRTTLV